MRNAVRLPARQAGLGALGWLIVLAIASFLLTCLLKVGPVYIDHWQLKQALDELLENPGVASQSKPELMEAIRRNFEVNRIETIKPRDLRVTETRDGRELDASYERRVPLLHNIDVVVKFDQFKYTLPAR